MCVVHVYVCVCVVCCVTFGIRPGCQTTNFCSDSLRCTTSLWLHRSHWPSITGARMYCPAGRQRCLSFNIRSQPAPVSVQTAGYRGKPRGRWSERWFSLNNLHVTVCVCGSLNGHLALQHPQPFLQLSPCLFSQVKHRREKRGLYFII